jgi:type IV pilus assembly protein PilM
MSVGIDIGSKTIKVIELKRDGDKHILKAAAVLGVKNFSIDKIQDEGESVAFSQTLKKLVSDAKISSKNVFVSLPESQVFTRNIKFPLLTDQEIASAVKWQAEEIIPIPLKEAIFQYMIIDRKETTQPGEVSVLVVAAPRVLVEKYVKIISAAGLTVIGAETELLASTRALSIPNQTVVIIDFGAKSTDIAIARNSKLVFSRTIPTAGDAFSRAVAQTLNIDPLQAEEYKKTYGLTENQLEGKVYQALNPIFKIVVEEVKKAIHFYQADSGGQNPNLIILSGGTAGLPGITSTLTKQIGVEVVIANPFAKVAVNPDTMQKLGPYAPLYSVAVGLALKEE